MILYERAVPPPTGQRVSHGDDDARGGLHGSCRRTAVLVAACTNSQFPLRVVKMEADLYFIEGRVRFLRADAPAPAAEKHIGDFIRDQLRQ